MAKAIIMPKFGFTQEDSEIVAWLVPAGSEVEEGDPIAEVTTDKINMEVEAPVSGILDGIRYDAGSLVPVTEIIAYILAPGETVPDEPEAAGVSEGTQTVPVEVAEKPAPASSVAITPVAARMAAAEGVDIAQLRTPGDGRKIKRADVAAALEQKAAHVSDKVRATPAARRVAREHDVDLATVPGSGPANRIQEQDVVRHLESVPVAAVAGVTEATDDVQVVPFSRMRRTIAANLQSSWQQAPHITFSADIDLTALEALIKRARNLPQSTDTPGVNITAAMTRCIVWALTRNPRINSHIDGDTLLQYAGVHIGMAVALDDGLIVPVIRDAQRKGMVELGSEIRDLAQRARTGKLRPDELRGATFSISNLGMAGIDRFTAVINPPEVGIMAIGRARRTIVPDDHDQPVVRSLATLTLSVDHRAVDGAVAARFMADVRMAIEQPDMMLL